MNVNTSKVIDKLQSRSLAESPQVRRHRGVVQSMAVDGTVGITLDGGSTVITGVRRLDSIVPGIGDTVELLGDDTDLFIIGRIPTEGWASVTFEGGWANYGGTWAATQYRKYPDGDVALRGLANGTGRTADGIFTLPAGYRPPASKMFLQAGQKINGYNSYRVDVQSDGVVRTVTAENPTGTPTYMSLSGIRFSTLGTGA